MLPTTSCKTPLFEKCCTFDIIPFHLPLKGTTDEGKENRIYMLLNDLRQIFIILQWAEVLSADAFSAFEDAGLDNIKVSLLELPRSIFLSS